MPLSEWKIKKEELQKSPKRNDETEELMGIDMQSRQGYKTINAKNDNDQTKQVHDAIDLLHCFVVGRRNEIRSLTMTGQEIGIFIGFNYILRQSDNRELSLKLSIPIAS